MSDSQNIARVFSNPVHFLAFGFGSGLSPKAPGTVGTIAAIPVYILAAHLFWPGYVLFLVVTFGLGVYVCDKTSQDMGVHDHGGIVWDEFVGFWLTMFLAPAGWIWIVVGFLLFRLFDILKPFPIGWLDRKVTGGLGIMLDDIVAGVFAWLCLQALHMVV
jgi:phosphatidylglycerophosphatase A